MPGQLLEEPFRDFEYNRNHVLTSHGTRTLCAPSALGLRSSLIAASEIGLALLDKQANQSSSLLICYTLMRLNVAAHLHAWQAR